MYSKIRRIAGVIIVMLFYCKAGFTQPDIDCCNNVSCRQEAERLVKKVVPLLSAIGTAGNDAAANRKKLEALRATNPVLFNDFNQTIKAIIRFTDADEKDQCFHKLLPTDQHSNLDHWVIYINDQMNPVDFSSPEWCSGFTKRFEISQGAANFLYKDMAYLGSVRGYAIYTLGKKNTCGNRFRLMAGPAAFLLNRTPYVTLSSRLGYRFKDLKGKAIPVSIGNLNMFGEYTTSFNYFHYAALGVEAQFGTFFGLNLSVNHNMRSNHQGFLIGFFLYSGK